MSTKVKKGTCFCDPKVSSFKCKKEAKGTYCTCVRKPFCSLNRSIDRKSCRCQIKPTRSLADENSEKKRVFRGYGWKKCKPKDPTKPAGPSKCECRVLKCYDSGRFKKYFCKCPRLTKQYCSKKTGYCKCLSKKPIKMRYPGTYRFRGLIPTSALKLASFKYEKRIIKIYTKGKKLGLEKRWIFVDHHNGSFYVVRKPSIVSDLDLRQEMSFYDPEDQNAKDIQKQIQKKSKKVLK